jgi:hypothetical protein
MELSSDDAPHTQMMIEALPSGRVPLLQHS